mmetsp:Transcript_19065/g.33920  ORF Transcript_19065/g.33920 Transcript_19065/m.33920 type:complete len:328 (-) Transcript_19065:361-1344(-)
MKVVRIKRKRQTAAIFPVGPVLSVGTASVRDSGRRLFEKDALHDCNLTLSTDGKGEHLAISDYTHKFHSHSNVGDVCYPHHVGLSFCVSSKSHFEGSSRCRNKNTIQVVSKVVGNSNDVARRGRVLKLECMVSEGDQLVCDRGYRDCRCDLVRAHNRSNQFCSLVGTDSVAQFQCGNELCLVCKYVLNEVLHRLHRVRVVASEGEGGVIPFSDSVVMNRPVVHLRVGEAVQVVELLDPDGFHLSRRLSQNLKRKVKLHVRCDVHHVTLRVQVPKDTRVASVDATESATKVCLRHEGFHSLSGAEVFWVTRLRGRNTCEAKFNYDLVH